jgi:hypothetical protein
VGRGSVVRRGGWVGGGGAGCRRGLPGRCGCGVRHVTPSRIAQYKAWVDAAVQRLARRARRRARRPPPFDPRGPRSPLTGEGDGHEGASCAAGHGARGTTDALGFLVWRGEVLSFRTACSPRECCTGVCWRVAYCRLCTGRCVALIALCVSIGRAAACLLERSVTLRFGWPTAHDGPLPGVKRNTGGRPPDEVPDATQPYHPRDVDPDALNLHHTFVISSSYMLNLSKNRR